MKKNELKKIIIMLLEVLLLIALSVVIVYLIKSENGILGKLNQKKANEKLDEAIKNFMEAEDGRDLEEYIREIEGVEDVKIDREKGIIDLKIDGEELFVVVEPNNQQNIEQ